jgi:hypothetical protein
MPRAAVNRSPEIVCNIFVLHAPNIKKLVCNILFVLHVLAAPPRRDLKKKKGLFYVVLTTRLKIIDNKVNDPLAR